MQILELKIPKYTSSFLQENKTPNNIKTIRGKGILETRSNFTFDEKIILTFNVDEEMLREFIKIQARFQTLILLPIFDKELMKKIISAYKVHDDYTTDFLTKKASDPFEEEENSIDFLDKMNKLKYKNIPECSECFFVFLENFSFKSIASSSNGYEVEMTILPCEDLSFFTDNKEDFVYNFFKEFKTKKSIFEKIDKTIDEFFMTKHDSINLNFDNIFNSQETYTKDKKFLKEETPESIIIPNHFITDLEIRSYNNLRRIPIQNKPKGFIQHLGKGEIAISVRLVLNEKEAEENTMIEKIRGFTMSEQKHIISTSSEFYLFKAMDLKEIDLINATITEPTDEVNATIVNLLFMGACTNKESATSEYVNSIDRKDTLVYLDCFNNFLDEVLGSPVKYKEFVIINSLKGNSSAQRSVELDNNFNMIDLTTSYSDREFLEYLFLERYSKSSPNKEYFNQHEKAGESWSKEVFGDEILPPLYGTQFFMHRINVLSYKYLKEEHLDKKTSFDNLINYDKKTKDDFYEEVLRKMMADRFNFKFDRAHLDLTIIGRMFMIEVVNNLILLIKTITEEAEQDPETKGIFTSEEFEFFGDKNKINPKIIKLIEKSTDRVFKEMRKVLMEQDFKQKAIDLYILETYSGDITAKIKNGLQKSVTGARKQFIQRYDEMYSTSTESVNEHVKTAVVTMFKLSTIDFEYYRKEVNGKEKLTKKEINTKHLCDVISTSIMGLFMCNFAYERKSLMNMLEDVSSVTIGGVALCCDALTAKQSKSISIINDKNTNEIMLEQEKEILIGLNMIAKNINEVFGAGAYENLRGFNKTFESVDLKNKDYQKIYGISVYDSFDKPLLFLKNIIDNTTPSLNFYRRFNAMSGRIAEIEKMPPKEILEDRSVMDIFEKKLNENKTISENSFNEKQSGNISSNVGATDFLSDLKLYKGLHNLTGAIVNNYEKMLPDFEIMVIEQNRFKGAMDNEEAVSISKFYDIQNVYHVSVDKDDLTNLKTATIKIFNSRPQYVNPNSIFIDTEFDSENKKDTVLYSRKFKTARPVLKEGMVINISFDRNNEYYDFTGRIDTINIGSSEINITCVSFASELLNQTFDISCYFKHGLTSVLSKNWGNIAMFFEKGQLLSGETDNPNTSIIPTYKLTDYKNPKYIGGAMHILYMALGEVLESIPHLNNSYNDLLMKGTSIGDSEYEINDNVVINFMRTIANHGLTTGDTKAQRITENINDVDRDSSFYGRKIVKGKTRTEGERIENGTSSFLCTSDSGLSLKSSLYSFKREKITLNDVLNALTFRSPGTFWEVYESGNYATLFFGRNNYKVKIKNKKSEIKIQEINKISDFLITKITTADKKDFIQDMRAAARIYDLSFTSSNKAIEELETFVAETRSSYNDQAIIETKDEATKTKYSNSLDVVNKIYAVGGHNLVACNIQVNKNCPNEIIVEYSPTFSQKVANWINVSSGAQVSMRLFEDIPPEDLRTKFIKNEDTIDLHTPEQALEYAQSVLYKELTNYYSGQIIMLYEPNIRKGTEVTLLDSTNKIFGTVIVRDYHHVLDHESGMITVITPGMKIRTTSITDDIYLHGIWSKINYEMEKSEYLSTTNYERTKSMNKTLRALTEKNREAAKMLVDTPVLLNNVSYLLKKDDKGDLVTNKVEGLRNTKELPFKIYPLIKSGIPVMPDFEIYGARSKTFQPLMNAFLAIRHRSVDRIVLAEKRAELIGTIKKRMSDIFEIGYSASLAKTADIFAGDQSLRFDDKILYEDYTDVEVVPNDKTICIFNKRLMKENAWGFMNCAKLKFYEEDRIRNIAKIMFHFKTVSLVELDGRGIEDVTKESDFQSNNFRVIERLKYYLEEFSKIYNKPCKNWVVISAHRLSTRPVEIAGGEWYDDVGAFIVNYENNEAIEKFKDLGTVHVEGRSIVNGEVVAKKKNALIIKSNTSDKELFNNSLISVFHNFYGGFNGSSEVRREVYNDLKDKLKDRGHNERIVIAGDFNLQLMNGVEEYLTNDESNERVDVSSFVPTISKERTTKAGRMYDNFVVRGSTRHLMATTFRYFNSDADDYFDFGATHFISDHFPIYIKSTI